MRAAASCLALALLAACGPSSVEQAEAACRRSAELAERPRGSVAVGAMGGGGSFRGGAQVSVEMSSDYILGRDPAAVYASCVQRRSGQAPTRPYDSRI